MPRLPRNFLPGVAVHLIQRGNNMQACFYTDRDYIVYLGKLRDSSAVHRIAIHAYVLMTNHVHILCTPADRVGIGKMMQGRSLLCSLHQFHVWPHRDFMGRAL